MATSSSGSNESDDHAEEYYDHHVFLESIPREGQRLLQDYSGLSSEEILPHVVTMMSNMHMTSSS